MHAWVTYELVQVLHIYGLTPLVRSNLKDVSLDLFKIETFLRDRTNQDANNSKHAEAMIKRLFADTEHSAIFKKMIMGNMSYFKQLTTYAIPFLLITWLQQLEEHFFLKHDDDFFVKGMYTSISSRAKNTTTTNNIWMMLNPSVGKDSERADSLSFFEPKQRKEVCVTLREWAAFILKCEYEPPTLDATSKAILKQSHLKKKKYEMLNDDLRWNTFHEEPEKKSKAKATPINVTKMTNKDLYLNVCQVLTIGATNTKSKHDKLINVGENLALAMIMKKQLNSCWLRPLLRNLQLRTLQKFQHKMKST
jgi:hypothetical protein